eukprot:scaffold35708_cov18-Tisochrysis_lutea.AAC.1
MVTDTFPHAQVAIRTFVLFHKAKASPSARCASACTGHLCCFSRPKPAQLYGGSCEGHIAHIHPDRSKTGTLWQTETLVFTHSHMHAFRLVPAQGAESVCVSSQRMIMGVHLSAFCLKGWMDGCNSLPLTSP